MRAVLARLLTPPIMPEKPVLINGSFETPSIGAGNFQYNSTGGTWSFIGKSGLQSNGSAFGSPNAPVGTQTALIQTSGTLVSNISQSFTIKRKGLYRLRFFAAARFNPGPPLQVLIDGVKIGNPINAVYAQFNQYSTPYKLLNPGTHTLVLSVPQTGTDLTIFVDDIAFK